MKEFLRQIAERYYAELSDGICECCFVFPNRRSALFFQKYLGQAAGKPVFAPHMVTINDLFSELSGLRQAGKVEMLYMLYKRYAALMWPDGDVKESFDEFVYWGDTLLNDFDDIDKYRVDAEKLFTNIKDLKDLDSGYGFLEQSQIDAIKEFWRDFLSGPGSPVKDGDSIDKKAYFAKIWSILYALYSGFRNDLQERGLAYEGMIYRNVSDTLKQGAEDERAALISRLSHYSRIVFVGLNALNECEKVLLNSLKAEGVADFYWDFAGPMVTDKDNKSSMLMTENVADYPSRYEIEPCLPAERKFRSIAVPSGVGQTQVVTGLLEEICGRQGRVAEETAVVLPDEGLLMPMLGAVPGCFKSMDMDINVTMGVPLDYGNTATFTSMIERLHRNKRVKTSGCSFYHRDVVAILDHPFVRKCIYASEDKSVWGLVSEITSEIRKKNLIYIPAEELAGRHPLFAAIFQDIQSVDDFRAYFELIFGIVQKTVPALEREFIYQMETCICSLHNLGIEMQQSTYFRLLKQLASVLQVHFRGEPLSGLQIMGPLETRALDFKNVIILSVNEGTFPKRSVSASFIPYNLRKGFGLPTYELQDAISAYHFYRSICRAENITLLYDSRTEGLNSGEESRYIKQLRYHFDVNIPEEKASFSLSGHVEKESVEGIAKTPEIMAAMKEHYSDNGKFAATTLNEYLNCGVKFYYARVKHLSDLDEVSESFDSKMFGLVFHKVMEDIYRPMEGKTVTAGDLDIICSDDAKIDRMIDAAFESECQIVEITGRNIIVKQLIHEFVKKVLELDKGRTPFILEGAENERSFDLEIPDLDFKVKVYGKIDRLDNKDGLLRIVDYKTGTVGKKADFKDINDLFAAGKASDGHPDIAFQLCLYALLMLRSEDYANADNLVPTVYALRELYGGQPVERLVSKNEAETFEKLLKELIAEIFNPDVPFKPAPEKSNSCSYCDFKKLCNR